MNTNYTHFPSHFVSYETNRLTCNFPNVQTFLAAMEIFDREGFDTSDFYVLEGEKGIRALDPDGHGHGLWSRFLRKIHNLISEAEEHSIEDLVHDLELGMVHVGIYAPEPDVRHHAHMIMKSTNGKHITFFGKFYIETFDQAS